MDTSDDARQRSAEQDDPEPGALPVEPADNGEPVFDPEVDEDAAGRAAAAGVEHLEDHQGDHR